MRSLIAINRVCLVFVACGIGLWSNVRLSGRVADSNRQFIIPLNVLVEGENEKENDTRRATQHTAISSPPPGNKGSLSSTTPTPTTTASVSTLSWLASTSSDLDDVLDQIYNEADKINVKNTTTTTSIIPKTIFMFWDQGWNVAPPLQQLAMQMAQRLNPLYEFHALDRDSIEERSNRRLLLDDEFFGKLSIQAKSDVYRTLLLYKYGGIWIDATAFVNKPLDDWLDGYVNHSYTDLWGFQRTRPLIMHPPIDPFIFMESWFLAAPPKSKTVANIIRVIVKEPHRLTKEYFWWHRIVSELAQQHDAISSNDNKDMMIRRNLFSNNILPSMNSSIGTPVIKKRHINQFAMAFSVWKDCCGGVAVGSSTSFTSSASNITHLCAQFHCDLLGANFGIANEIEKAYNRTMNSWKQSFETPQYQLEQAKRATQ